MDNKHALLKLVEQGDSVKLECLQEFGLHSKYVVSMAWSSDGKMFASGSHDRSVGIYSLNEQQTGIAQSIYIPLKFTCICA